MCISTTTNLGSVICELQSIFKNGENENFLSRMVKMEFFCGKYRFLEMLKMLAKIDNGNSKDNIF